jgi:hypothetical protein
MSCVVMAVHVGALLRARGSGLACVARVFGMMRPACDVACYKRGCAAGYHRIPQWLTRNGRDPVTDRRCKVRGAGAG